MFDEIGRESEAVDIMRFVWTGECPPYRAPRIMSICVNCKGRFDNLIVAPANRQAITWTAPLRSGPYRIFVSVYDSHGHFASANVPFFVEK